MGFPPDVPSPIDLRQATDAREWASTAMSLRPWRVDFFDTFARRIGQAAQGARVLELGSGPGFLAAHLLERLPGLDLHLLDFSAPMHALARERLGPRSDGVTFLLRDFLDPAWADGLGPFDFVITHQAVHELRHKRRAATLHQAVKPLLRPEGAYLVCDHHAGDGGMRNDQLYMTIDEHQAALREAGFTEVVPLLQLQGMVLHEGR